MKKVFGIVMALVMLISCITVGVIATPAGASAQSRERTAPYRNVMYYGDWSIYDCQDFFNPSDIDASLITHLNFAFLDFDANCNLILCDEYADFEAQLPEHGKDELQYDAPYSGVLGAMCILREKNPNLKIGISIGGWTRSGDFSVVAADPAKRALLAKNLAKFIDYLGFDFLDVDWEYPTDKRAPDPEGNGVAIDEGHPHGSRADGHNFTLLMKAFREELDALGKKNGKHYELSAAMSANTNKMKAIEYDEVLKYADFLNMMTYDLNGSWNDYTGHQTGLYTNPAYKDANTPDGVFSIDACIQYLKKTYGNSIDYSQIVVGVSAYTRGWAGVKGNGPDKNNPGLFVPALANSVPDEEKLKGGVYAFHDVPALCQKYGVKECYDETAQAAYLYGPDTGYFFTYDNERSVKAKGQYVKDNGLGGLICWMASQDKDHVLTRTMKESLIGNGSFPDHEIKVATPDVKVTVRAQGKNGYVFTIKNLEKSVESDKTMKRAERFQKTVMNGKFYVKTKSGAKFSAGEDGSDCGKIYNKNGFAIIDLASAYENQVLEAGRTCTFSVKTSGKSGLDDIEYITMTQRILPSMKEFGETLVYGSNTPVDPIPTEPIETTIPETTVPETTVPETTVPETTVPETTVPETTVPETTVPETTVPETTVPETTVPETTVPETTVPETTVPETTVPETTVPETTVPETTVPETTVPETTDPETSVPDDVKEWVEYSNYAKGDLVAYKGQVYECNIAHTSLPGWEPTAVPALWVKQENAEVPNPTDPDATDPTDPKPLPGDTWDANKVYNGGEVVIYNGQKFSAKWWTRGETPNASNLWGVWKPL